MNEQIWKLAEQIVCFEQDMDGSMEPNENGQWIRADDLAKFAELIVRECAEVSKNYAGGSMPLSIALAIKKHFGVEE